MNAFISELKSIRKIYDMRDVLGIGERSSKIVCPLPDHAHHNHTPSFVITDGPDGQRFHCYGNCGHFGDVIDLMGYLYIPNYDDKNAEHVARAVTLLGTSVSFKTPEPPPPKIQLAQNDWKRYVPPGKAVAEYAVRRGLSPDTLQKFKVGQYKHFMSMPAFENGMLVAIKFRNLWPDCDDRDFDHLRFWSKKGSVKALLNYDAAAYQPEPVLVLKGEIPVMLADQYGLLACAPTGGEGSFVERWRPVLAMSRRTVVVGDNDRDPEVRDKMQAKAAERAEALGGALYFPPEKHKDWDEWVLTEPEEAIAATKSWLWWAH